MNWYYQMLKLLGLLPQAKTYKSGKLFIYSLPNLWWMLSDSECHKMFKAMAKAGHNATFCEINLDTNWLGGIKCSTLEQFIEHADRFHKIAQLYGMKVIWSFNWNNAAIANLSDKQFFDTMTALPKKNCGFELGEWDGSRNTDSANDAQAQRVCEKAEALWPDLNIWNKGCRPKNKPGDNEYICQHLAHRKDHTTVRGPRVIACTDHSYILDELGQGGRDFQEWDLGPMEAWSIMVLMDGDSAHWYHFMARKPDYKAIQKQGECIKKYGGE